jgi:hypothetical protein
VAGFAVARQAGWGDVATDWFAIGLAVATVAVFLTALVLREPARQRRIADRGELGTTPMGDAPAR